MPVFTRRTEPPAPQSDYQAYRQDVREDFQRCCAYCLRPESVTGGEEQFQLDHFKPKSIYPTLINEYYNLYWACGACNRFKGASPSKAAAAKGARFIDTAAERFDTHFENVMSNGTWQPITQTAKYTSGRLRLNSPAKMDLREKLNRIATKRGLPPVDWNQPSGPQIELLLEP